jgi:hypothetical protein
MPDHGRLGSWNRDRQYGTLGRPELDNVSAVVFRAKDHDPVLAWWSSLALFEPIKEQSTLPLKRAKTCL